MEVDSDIQPVDDRTTDVTTINSSNITNKQLFELQMALIKFVASSAKIFLIAQPMTWRDFYYKNKDLEYLQEHYEVDKLAKEFNDHVLPQIYSYNLTEKETACIDLLKLHPEYERTPEGFRHLPTNDRPLHMCQPKEGVHFHSTTPSHIKQLCTIPIDEQIDTLKLDGDTYLGNQHHTLIIPTVNNSNSQQRLYEYEFTLLIRCFLSAGLANNLELAASAIFDPSELHQRMRNAKRQFEQTGQMPPNFHSHTLLLDKVRRIHTMRMAAQNLLSSRIAWTTKE